MCARSLATFNEGGKQRLHALTAGSKALHRTSEMKRYRTAVACLCVWLHCIESFHIGDRSGAVRHTTWTVSSSSRPTEVQIGGARRFYGFTAGDAIPIARQRRKQCRLWVAVGGTGRPPEQVGGADQQHGLSPDHRPTAASATVDPRECLARMKALSIGCRSEETAREVEDLLARLKQVPGFVPARTAYDATILAWSKLPNARAGGRCEELLRELWGHYNATRSDAHLPSRATYLGTLRAHARGGMGRPGAVQAEALLEEMERWRRDGFPSLGPNTMAVNIVLHAWSQSKAAGSAARCEAILERLEQLSARGREELQPDTVSYNTVLDGIARSGVRGREQKAEALLYRMDGFKDRDASIYDKCKPDLTSFNIVLKCWARSSEFGAARRAEAILHHMEKRCDSGQTSIRPDVTAYNTVMTAWVRANEKRSVSHAENILQRMIRAYQGGNLQARPSIISYNIIIDGFIKSGHTDDFKKALKMVQSMKEKCKKEGNDDLEPDSFTYTPLIKGLATHCTEGGPEKALELISELEAKYKATGRESFKPSIHTYTCAVHVIARNRTQPDRALRVVERLQNLYASGEIDFQPDVSCYNALINAYGWSNSQHRAKKAFEIFQAMQEDFLSGKNPFAQPDTITCNSVINALAHDSAESEKERTERVRLAIKTLEAFQSEKFRYGSPNHISYANVLTVLLNHMAPGDERCKLVEATFWQCCKSGCVSVLVITLMHQVLPWERFSALLGAAVLSKEEEPLGFNWNWLPSEWTRTAPKPKQRRESRPSRRTSRTVRSVVSHRPSST